VADFLIPDWPAPAHVRALQTLRTGGCSPAPWASFNLGDHVGDEPARVAANRAELRRQLPAEPLWLQQVHGTVVVDAAQAPQATTADASFANEPDQVCAVMTADCLPVLFCDRAGSVVAAAHAGWRGLLDGILESTIAAMQRPPADLLAWLGPAIGPERFEVGGEVRAAFVAHDAQAAGSFRQHGDKWLADIYSLARQRLQAAGVTNIHGGGRCTVSDAERYFSYRRDGVTGRMATLIWLEAPGG
jgi:YfiH family protein